MSTTKASEPISGDMLYQQLARSALPILVLQASRNSTMTYSYLAKELEMANPRHLNYVLASIGQSLERLPRSWKVPPIQCFVVRKRDGLPGEGIKWPSLSGKKFARLSLQKKKEYVSRQQKCVYLYRRWNEVLNRLGLEPVATDFLPLASKVSGYHGGGENKAHKALKEYVARNPRVVGLKASTPFGVTESKLPSGDSLDVSFRGDDFWVAAEVKAANSDPPDIERGLFQCVKYRAVMNAVLRYETRPQHARVFLVLESGFPKSLAKQKKILGIKVVQGITPQKRPPRRVRSRHRPRSYKPSR